MKSSFDVAPGYRRLSGAHDRDGVANADATRKGGSDRAADIPAGRVVQPLRIEPTKRRVREERERQTRSSLNSFDSGAGRRDLTRASMQFDV
jgi:hypothetical protein